MVTIVSGGRVARTTSVSRPFAAIVVAALLLSVAGCANAAPAIPKSFTITGYADTSGTTTQQLAASAKAMTEVGIDGVTLTADGAGISTPDASARRLLAKTHALHLKASLLFSNWSNSIGDFSDRLAEKMFTSPAHITSVVAALSHEVTKDGWDGVTIDLESLNQWGAAGHTRDDNAGLTSFVTALRAALGSHSLSICLTATTGSYEDLGYDIPTIAKNVDHLALMAYDQHGPTWSKAGPIGGYPWVKASVASLRKSAPASLIQLGIGQYGYTWPTRGTGTTYSDAAARALVKRKRGTAVWSSTQQEWHATLKGETIWWSDFRSYRSRLALAQSLHLGGVAVWSLGEGDPL